MNMHLTILGSNFLRNWLWIWTSTHTQTVDYEN